MSPRVLRIRLGARPVAVGPVIIKGGPAQVLGVTAPGLTEPNGLGFGSAISKLLNPCVEPALHQIAFPSQDPGQHSMHASFSKKPWKINEDDEQDMRPAATCLQDFGDAPKIWSPKAVI